MTLPLRERAPPPISVRCSAAPALRIGLLIAASELEPTFKLERGGMNITQGTGALSIDLSSCGMYNLNAFVGSTVGVN